MAKKLIRWKENYVKQYLKHIIKTGKNPTFKYLKNNHPDFYKLVKPLYPSHKTMFIELDLESLIESDYIKK